MSSPLRSVESAAALERELSRLPASGRSLLLVGGADFTDCTPEVLQAVRRFLETLARICDAVGAAVVDGGTDSGVMRWFAEARAAVGGSFPLIGVAPAGALRRRTRTGNPIAPAHGHSVILAVPGNRFGDEQDRLFEIVDRLGARAHDRRQRRAARARGGAAATGRGLRRAGGRRVRPDGR